MATQIKKFKYADQELELALTLPDNILEERPFIFTHLLNGEFFRAISDSNKGEITKMGIVIPQDACAIFPFNVENDFLAAAKEIRKLSAEDRNILCDFFKEVVNADEPTANRMGWNQQRYNR